MLKGHVVARAPRELGAQTSVNTVFNVAFRGDVSNFLLRSLQSLHSGVQLVKLKHGERVDVTDVAHSLKLVKVLGVVNEIEHKVVLHSNIESLHLFRVRTSLGDGRIN